MESARAWIHSAGLDEIGRERLAVAPRTCGELVSRASRLVSAGVGSEHRLRVERHFLRQIAARPSVGSRRSARRNPTAKTIATSAPSDERQVASGDPEPSRRTAEAWPRDEPARARRGGPCLRAAARGSRVSAEAVSGIDAPKVQATAPTAAVSRSLPCFPMRAHLVHGHALAVRSFPIRTVAVHASA